MLEVAGGASERVDGAVPEVLAVYEAPVVRVLGTLAQLTAGGTTAPDDGVGGAGDVGSF